MMYCDRRLGGVPKYYLARRSDADMRVPEEIRKCVVYLGKPSTTPDGQESMAPEGTGFFVAIPSEMHSGINYIYLVTAKHVAKELMGERFIIRANVKGGRAVFITGSEDTRWWTHPTDDSVDVAVIGWAPPDIVDDRRVGLEMFLDDDIMRTKNIGLGDEVFMTGLFIHLAGSARNQPIVRMGNIAMIPDEPIPTSDLGDIEGYLIESRSIGGLSGSPAFVRETVSMGLGAFYLLGLMHGHWDIPSEQRDDSARPDAPADSYGKVNMGIAVVVPAKKIREVLFQPGLVEMRSDADQRRRKANMPTLDEALEQTTTPQEEHSDEGDQEKPTP